MATQIHEYTVEDLHVAITTFTLSVGLEHSTPSVHIRGNAASLETIKLQKKRSSFDLTISPFGAKLSVHGDVPLPLMGIDPIIAVKSVLSTFLYISSVIPERYRSVLLKTSRAELA